MRSAKQYSNVTITKRVDHEGKAAHRAPRSPAGLLVCGTCGATYYRRRWVPADVPVRPRTSREGWMPPKLVTCPACAQLEHGQPGGYVRLRGKFLAAHAVEIEQLLINEAARAARDNPLARFMSWDRPRRTELTVTTTTEHLAQRLGKAVEKAYGGEIRYDFSHENKLARVDWQRD